MLYSAIDIGSNTVQMMIAQVEQGRMADRRNWLRTTRLGSGTECHLTPEAIQDTVDAVADFLAISEQEGVSRSRILATSAVRDADNSQDLLAAIAAAVPGAPPVEILSGQQEAETSYWGVLASLEAPEHCPVIDQGGSSTELIYAEGQQLYCVSGDIGAVRAHVNGWDRREILHRVSNIYQKRHDADTLIGVGGTITTVAGVLLGLQDYNREAIEGQMVSQEQLTNLYEELLPLSLSQRCIYSPLLVKRGEIIQEGLEIWLSLLEFLQAKQVLVCGGGLLDGAIWQMLNKAV